MRAIVGLIVIAMIARAAAQPAPPVVPAPAKQTAPAGFDHARHAQATAGVACTQCHPLDRGVIAKSPSHATCFGKCHAEQATTLKLRESVPEDRLRYCNACHAETALVVPLDKKALAQVASLRGVEHGLQLGHNSHAQIACTKCHEPGRPRRGRPHERCLGCHGDKPEKTFAIAECEKCHPTGRDRPRLVRDTQIVVTTAFSHAKHGTRGAAKQCATCHAGIAKTDGRALPSPKVETCAIGGCHDGKAVFGALTSCPKCHQDVPRLEFKVARPVERFSHARHEPHTNAPCASCHPLSKSGEIQRAGHLACVEGCHEHERDFGASSPAICGACHDGTEPWRALIADKLPSDTTEFGATLDHGKHGTACASCHTLTTTRTELRPPRGHRSCTTAGCHAVTGGPTPQMTACEGCHQRGGQDARDTARLSAPWSVRANFRHRVHGEKVSVECVRCHTDLTSPKLLSLPVPAKATCSVAGCHDGRGAFKVTGTSCTRCHAGAKK